MLAMHDIYNNAKLVKLCKLEIHEPLGEGPRLKRMVRFFFLQPVLSQMCDGSLLSDNY